MNTLVKTLVLLVTISFTTVASPNPGKKDRPTKLAHYQVGTYITADRTKLRLNIDKELGGDVSVQLVDSQSRLYFYQVLTSAEDKVRLSMDISDLHDGNYKLKITNGLEVEVRNVRIVTPEPTQATRTISVLQDK